ncbi:MAG: GNAT family N-acetyltransferase [Armatimonadota bacterium]|nr:MAG: GNAT family N-acetyltransferase [Armatimonadota bacterium]
MTPETGAKPTIPRDLGDGLILRRATVDDTAALAAFNREIHCASDPPEVQNAMSVWIDVLMSGTHPGISARDFTVVEDVSTGAVVSSLCLISQTWSYAGIPFGVGQVELVGTRPEYRRRGLVRAQFEAAHRWSSRRRHKGQVVVGIPNFYRQFGYEMALEVGGSRIGFKAGVPAPKKGAKEPYRVRPATEADLPFMARVYRDGMRRYLVSCVCGSAVWRYELKGRNKRALESRQLCLIEAARGDRIGLLVHSTELWDKTLGVLVYELRPGANWLAPTRTVLRYLLATGEQCAVRGNKQFTSFAFRIGSQHPVYEVIPSRLPRTREPYAFYVRVPDLPDFIRHIAPVLERRLADSPAVGHTGELKLSFYQVGLRLVFDRGRLKQAEPWAPGEGLSAAFPGFTFLQLLFGRRSFDDLQSAYPDCYAADRGDDGDEVSLLLRVLFPKEPSLVWTPA